MHDDTGRNLIPHGEIDHEGAMAKADLFKLANYSVKLFKKIEDNDQLESWVQAKITKAADYIASVYHYLEYEMKFSEFGSRLENSEMYSESEKMELKNKLNEAREMLRTLKLAQAQKIDEAKSPKAKKDWDKDGKIESEKDEVIGSRRKAAGLDEAWDDDDEDDDVRRADQELKKKGVKLPKVKADPDKDMSKLAKKSKKDDDLDETYGQGVYESWDDDDEDDDVKKADSELKKRGIKLPKVKDKEVPIKKTAKDREEELDESKGADNFTGDDILALSKIDDIDAMKARAAELIQTPSRKPIKPEKVRYYLGQIERMSKPVEIVALMYNMLLGGEGQGVIGDKYSMGKSSYHKRFGEENMCETSDEKKKSYRSESGKDMQKSAKAGDKAAVSKRLKGVSASLKDKKVVEAVKKAKKDYDCDGKIESEKDEVWGSRMKAAEKAKKVEEAAPSAGLSAKKKSAVVEKAKAGRKNTKCETMKESFGLSGEKMPKMKRNDPHNQFTGDRPDIVLPYEDNWEIAEKRVITALRKKGIRVDGIDHEASPVIIFLKHGKQVAWFDLENSYGYITSEYPGPMDETSDEENDIISAPQPQPEPNPEENDVISAPMNEGRELDRIRMLSGL